MYGYWQFHLTFDYRLVEWVLSLLILTSEYWPFTSFSIIFSYPEYNTTIRLNDFALLKVNTNSFNFKIFVNKTEFIDFLQLTTEIQFDSRDVDYSTSFHTAKNYITNNKIRLFMAWGATFVLRMHPTFPKHITS